MVKKTDKTTMSTAITSQEAVVCDFLTADALALAATAPGPGEKPLRVLSLFSGCGGMDAGFEGWFIAPRRSFPADSPCVVRDIDDNWVLVRKTRFTTVFANDILPEAQSGWLGYMLSLIHI